jgi:hypothetical protein
MPKSFIPLWMSDPDICPYVILHQSNRTALKGARHGDFDWFQTAPLLKDPLKTQDFDFVNGARLLDHAAFGSAGLEMPKWVYYDCAILPGLIAGFAMKAARLEADFGPTVMEKLGVKAGTEWVPISLFIIIPTMEPGHWMAHNLCSINELVVPAKKLKGLGFLSKAFGLWYADVEYLFGVTQWLRPAVKLHTNFGYLSLVTAHTPLHTYSHSLTYRMKVDSSHWQGFFDRTAPQGAFESEFEPTGLWVKPRLEESLRDVQLRIERGEGPFFLSGREILATQVGERLQLYRHR